MAKKRATEESTLVSTSPESTAVAESDTNGTAPVENPAATATTAAVQKRGPLHRFRYSVSDGSLSASVFDKQLEREGKVSVVYSVSLQRSYYSEKDGKWLWTGYLREMDIPVALVALNAAYAFICNRKIPAEDCPF
jgi:hypothetical protein